ncbi:hypothetical protein SteCoe_13268 [Stentor coeruleus]|uniref:Uncharacterized protein n=1 Tax=Stentor coeruleus TaxID=5963 RepID=A0A1R2C8Z0_9CILI|nr:hypothetical protein SteCoe_13268 [Stentor coeruleus]
MSEYEESYLVSKGSSSVSRSIKQTRVRPMSLPWEEESLTFSRDKGAMLLKLQRENIELRKKLKEFNTHINEIINQVHQKKPKKTSPKVSPKETLETALKNLQYYEKEYLRLENRHSQLSDPNYQHQLKSQVDELKQKVQSYENRHKKNGGKQKIREKELIDVLDTGEKLELQKQFSEITTEISLYTQRYEKLKDLNSKTAQSYQDISSNLASFESQYENLKSLEPLLAETVQNPIQETKGKIEKIHSANLGKLESQIKLLSIKLKKLNEELALNKESENKITLELTNKTQEYKNLQLQLNDLQIKSISSNHKRLQSQNDFPDESFFTTENPYN